MIYEFPTSAQPQFDLAFSPKGRLLAVAAGKVVDLYDVERQKIVHTLSGHSARIAAVSFSPDNQRLATASADKSVKVWDLNTGQELLTLRDHENIVEDVFFHWKGNRLFSYGSNTLRIFTAPRK